MILLFYNLFDDTNFGRNSGKNWEFEAGIKKT